MILSGLIEFWTEKYYRESKSEGRSDRSISQDLGISERTLRRKEKIFTKYKGELFPFCGGKRKN